MWALQRTKAFASRRFHWNSESPEKMTMLLVLSRGILYHGVECPGLENFRFVLGPIGLRRWCQVLMKVRWSDDSVQSHVSCPVTGVPIQTDSVRVTVYRSWEDGLYRDGYLLVNSRKPYSSEAFRGRSEIRLTRNHARESSWSRLSY
jgi:hypothetical protein